jgi:diguanylate cyclase (GGDEF)-like protein
MPKSLNEVLSVKTRGMDYFGLEAEITSLGQQLGCAPRGARAELQARLAWALRRRRTRRAWRLASLALARGADKPDTVALAVLVQAEASWLYGDLDAANEYLVKARARFDELHDSAGQGDCLMLEAVVQQERGFTAERNAAYAAARQAYEQCGDETRLRLAQVRIANFAGYDNPQAAREAWASRLTEWDHDGTHPALRAAIQAAWGAITFQRDAGVAVRHHQRAYEYAMAGGDLAMACMQAANAGGLATNIKAMDMALEWAERGVRDAAPTGWQRIGAWCKVQMAVVLAELKRYELAKALLREAHAALKNYPNRMFAHACWYLGDVYLDVGEAEQALQMHRETERAGRHIGNADLTSHGLRGQAMALSLAGRVQEAVETVQRGLAFAREHSGHWHEVIALQALGNLSAEHGLPLPHGATAPSAAVHYYEQALEVAAKIDGYGVEPGLYLGLSRGYEAAGDLARALQFERKAAEARQAAASKHAADVAIGMQIRYETEQARAEAEHHRALAAAQAQRAQLLETARDTLQHLAAIGQKITANLSAEAVFQALRQHVGALLDAPCLSVFLVEGQQLVLRYGLEHGQLLPPLRIALDSADSQAARCIRERRLLVLEWPEAGCQPALVPGTQPMASAMFVPLAAGDNVLGAMSVQSDRHQAYGEREWQILTMLAAYGSVALGNAQSARRLAAAEGEAERLRALSLERANQVLEQEKERLSRESFEDPLTGLFNRRRLDLALGEQLAPGAPDKVFSVALVDIDFFKRVNDNFSHQMGDEVLKVVGLLLRQACRQQDLAARYGGEEFALLFSRARASDAGIACERLRAAVQRHPWAQLHPDLKITVSIGVADSTEGADAEAIFALADKRLYAAKHGGRNQVVSAGLSTEAVAAD